MFSCTVFSCPLGPFRSEMCVFIQQFVQNKQNKKTVAHKREELKVLFTPPQCLPANRPRMAAYLGHRAADKGRLVPQLSSQPVATILWDIITGSLLPWWSTTLWYVY